LISIKFYYDPLKCLEYEAELLEKVDKHKSGEGGMTFRGQISKVATDMNDLQALRGLKFQ
jgi:metal-dependent HD superfamily phosphatase/phosphodiesterase